jgi:hypothetical protein
MTPFIRPCLLNLALLSLLSGPARAAEGGLRQCTNEGCRRHALSDTWQFCPYCGTKLPAPALKKPGQEDEIRGNIFASGKYGFQIERPSEEWNFLTGKKLSEELNEDATLGLTLKDEVFSMVIVERMPGVTAEQYLNLVAPALDNRSLVYQKPLEIPGVEGIRAKFAGTNNGIPFHFYYKVLAYGEMRLQVVSWLIAGNDSEQHQTEIAAIEDSVQLLGNEQQQ